jgi:hypothetical protein
MSHRTAAWLAWSLCAVCVALSVLALILAFVVPPIRDRPSTGLAVLMVVLALAYPTVGALIASRLPTNPIGWIFCSFGLLYVTQRFTEAYADYALLKNFAMPGGEYVAWFSNTVASGAPPVLVAVFLLLLFPDGHLLSRRWRIVAWTAILGAAFGALGDALYPGNLPTHTYVENPFGVLGIISGGGFTTYDLFTASLLLGWTLLLTSEIAALFSLIGRLHRAWGNVRQQIKWVLYAAVPAVLCGTLVSLNYMVVRFTYEFLSGPRSIVPWEDLQYVLYASTFATLLVPVFTYIAILKYHLFDIDVVINRTLVYGSLTTTLLALYLGVIVVLQRVFVLLTGQRSTLAVVASTLLIAALFTPLRRRIQSFIDRRFYRRKYDARKTLETFSAQLRNETDLEALSDDLEGVIRETMQPAHVSLWLRPETTPKDEQAWPE